MKNSKAAEKAEQIIQRIQSALEAAPSPASVDALIEAALNQLEGRSTPATSRDLIDQVAPIIQDLFDRAPHIHRRLNASQARDEAAFLVGQCLTSAPGEGFETTMLKVRDPSLPGMEVLYRRLGERLKERLQRTYVDWVFARHLDPADWETNRAVAEWLLERLRPDMPPEAPTMTPEEFVDCIPDLFFLVRDLDAMPSSVLRHPFRSA